ncbi:MAG: citB4 [Candidatus Angelobacter sp.]|jgi:two-component system invasion response regulator UvrY|nr:citB4 [Candidatus Angelobacter sp.]
MIKILIADDHAVVREGVKRILTDQPLYRFGEAATAEETLSAIRNSDWDILILDLSLPARGGLAVLEELESLAPKLRTIVYSMHPEDQFGLRVLRAGAVGYLAKERAPEELIQAIEKVRAGGLYITETLAENLATHLKSGDDLPLHHRLSGREYTVFEQIAKGQSVSQIAEALCLSVKTVSTYRARILEKMGLASNADLIRYALNQRLIE